jgi:hypothetical protein
MTVLFVSLFVAAQAIFQLFGGSHNITVTGLQI